MERELQVDHVASKHEWFGRTGTSVGVEFKSANRYEFADVPDATWAELEDLVDRNEQRRNAGTRTPQKPHDLSFTAFYERLEDDHPCWKVEYDGGRCTPLNQLAHDWESANGPRGTTQAHRYLNASGKRVSPY